MLGDDRSEFPSTRVVCSCPAIAGKIVDTPEANVLVSGLLIIFLLRNGAISHNPPQIASNRTLNSQKIA